jgi:FkbM family methyltransferase
MPRGADLAAQQSSTGDHVPDGQPQPALKRAARLLFWPLERAMREVLRFLRRALVGHIEFRVDALRAQSDRLLHELQALQAQQADRQARLEEIITARHATLEEIITARHATLEEIITARHATLEEIITARHATLEALGRDARAQLSHALELTQLLHTKTDEIGLRSRGALALDPATFALRTYDGFVLVPREDVKLLLMLLDAGPQGLEPGTRRIIIRLLAPGMTFIDVGANIGLLTLAGARAVGSNGKVLAIEPVPLAFDLLNRGLAINELEHRVETKCQALGARAERRKFFVSPVLGHSSFFHSQASVNGSASEIEVDVVPLDDLIPAGERVDVVKIDVEGAELAVLDGMSRVISDNPDLAIIAEFGPSHLKATHVTPESWFSAFRDRGFDGYVIDELSADCRSVDLRELADVDSANILFGQPGSSIVARALR